MIGPTSNLTVDLANRGRTSVASAARGRPQRQRAHPPKNTELGQSPHVRPSVAAVLGGSRPLPLHPSRVHPCARTKRQVSATFSGSTDHTTGTPATRPNPGRCPGATGLLASRHRPRLQLGSQSGQVPRPLSGEAGRIGDSPPRTHLASVPSPGRPPKGCRRRRVTDHGTGPPTGLAGRQRPRLPSKDHRPRHHRLGLDALQDEARLGTPRERWVGHARNRDAVPYSVHDGEGHTRRSTLGANVGDRRRLTRP